MFRYNADATAYIESRVSPQREICQALRELILGNFQHMVEEYKWRYPAYYYQRRRICLIGGFKYHANIELFYGAHLKDSKGQIAGLGKHTRHIKFTSLKEIDAPYLVDLVQQSITLSQTNPRR